MILQLETTLESMRDDFVGLSAEWEATIKLIHKEKRRSSLSQAPISKQTCPSRMLRAILSHLEADEDAARSATGNEDDDDDSSRRVGGRRKPTLTSRATTRTMATWQRCSCARPRPLSAAQAWSRCLRASQAWRGFLAHN